MRPKLIVIAGPNGSGKTTFTPLILQHDWSEGCVSEEIKRRVAVIQNMKASLINGKATFVRSLHDCMKQRHPASEVLNDMMLDAADLYENAVLDVFQDIYEQNA